MNTVMFLLPLSVIVVIGAATLLFNFGCCVKLATENPADSFFCWVRFYTLVAVPMVSCFAGFWEVCFVGLLLPQWKNSYKNLHGDWLHFAEYFFEKMEMGSRFVALASIVYSHFLIYLILVVAVFAHPFPSLYNSDALRSSYSGGGDTFTLDPSLCMEHINEATEVGTVPFTSDYFVLSDAKWSLDPSSRRVFREGDVDVVGFNLAVSDNSSNVFCIFNVHVVCLESLHAMPPDLLRYKCPKGELGDVNLRRMSVSDFKWKRDLADYAGYRSGDNMAVALGGFLQYNSSSYKETQILLHELDAAITDTAWRCHIVFIALLLLGPLLFCYMYLAALKRAKVWSHALTPFDAEIGPIFSEETEQRMERERREREDEADTEVEVVQEEETRDEDVRGSAGEVGEVDVEEEEEERQQEEEEEEEDADDSAINPLLPSVR